MKLTDANKSSLSNTLKPKIEKITDQTSVTRIVSTLVEMWRLLKSWNEYDFFLRSSCYLSFSINKI